MKFKRIYIEITNICNLKCYFCPPHNRENRSMTFDEFKIILEKIKPYTEYIYLHVKGEPMLHPEFDNFVKYAYENNFKINLTTNGTLLKNHLAITKFLRQINISLHATNSKDIIKTAKEINDTIINFRVWNINENLEAIQLLENEFNTKIESSKNFTLGKNKFLSQESLFKWPDISSDDHFDTGYCHALKDQIAILVDGTVVPCCLDNNGDLNLGNIFTQTFEEILHSSRTQNIIVGFKNRVAAEKLCQKCAYKNKF